MINTLNLYLVKQKQISVGQSRSRFNREINNNRTSVYFTSKLHPKDSRTLAKNAIKKIVKSNHSPFEKAIITGILAFPASKLLFDFVNPANSHINYIASAIFSLFTAGKVYFKERALQKMMVRK